MTAPRRPTTTERFFAQYQYPILLSTFGLQVCHHQYIKRSQLVFQLTTGSVKTASLPRPLTAGLVWAAVFAGLLTKITLSNKVLRDYSDPVIVHSYKRASIPREASV
jgi:hypothetical protein